MRTRAASIIIGLAKILTGQVADHLGGVAAQMAVNVVWAVLEPIVGSKVSRSDRPGDAETSGTPAAPIIAVVYVPSASYVLFVGVRIGKNGFEQLEVTNADEDPGHLPFDQ